MRTLAMAAYGRVSDVVSTMGVHKHYPRFYFAVYTRRLRTRISLP